MKTKRVLSLSLLILMTFAGLSFAGTVRTKDTPKEGGGYYNENYHLKGKGHQEGYVDKKQNWRNPFQSFGETGKKGKGVGPKEMPHSR